MKLFQEKQLYEAYEFAAAGGQALHFFSDPGTYLGAPGVFKASRVAAHLFDRDTERLITTARKLGVRVIKIGRKGTPKQHVDLCGRPLQRARMVCVLHLPKRPREPQDEKKGMDGRKTTESG